MLNMTIDKFSGVILIPFPFTDQTTIKKRPAVVVSSDEYNCSVPKMGKNMASKLFEKISNTPINPEASAPAVLILL